MHWPSLILFSFSYYKTSIYTFEIRRTMHARSTTSLHQPSFDTPSLVRIFTWFSLHTILTCIMDCNFFVCPSIVFSTRKHFTRHFWVSVSPTGHHRGFDFVPGATDLIRLAPQFLGSHGSAGVASLNVVPLAVKTLYRSVWSSPVQA